MAISPNTPPGTAVVCISSYGPLIEVGKVYTVASIFPGFDRNGLPAHAVALDEVEECRFGYGFRLHRFKLAVLPKSLTDCLTNATRKEPSELVL